MCIRDSIGDYNRDWVKELAKAEKVAGQLQPVWKAYLYLKKMRLNHQQYSQVLVASQGNFTVEALQFAALKSFPSMREGGGTENHRRESYPTKGGRFNNGRFRRGKGRGKGGRRSHGTHHVDGEEDDDPEGNEDGEESEVEGDEAVYHEGDDHEQSSESDESEFDEIPDEIRIAEQEAQVLMTRAKKARRDMDNARGFYKKGQPQAARTAGVNPLKQRLPCAKCGETGHWKDDVECPMYGKPFPNKKHGKKGDGKHGHKRHGHKKKRKSRKKKPRRRRTKDHGAHSVFVTDQRSDSEEAIAAMEEDVLSLIHI